MTLYSDAAIVRQQYVIPLQKDTTRVFIGGLPETVDASFIALQPIKPNALPPLSMKLLSPHTTYSSLVQLAVGERVVLRRSSGERVEGILLVAPSGIANGTEPCHNGAIIKTALGELLVSPCGELVVPTISEEKIYSSHTVEATILSRAPARTPFDFVYRCDGLQWRAEYSAILEGERILRLEGYAQLLNSTRVPFICQRLQLVAGTVQMRKNQEFIGGTAMRAGHYLRTSEEPATTPVSEEISEYYLYTVPFPVTLEPNTVTTLLLRQPVTLPVTQRLVVRDWLSYYGHSTSSDETSPIPVNVTLEVVNTAPDSLPLPQGSVHIWRRDAQGTLQFVGDDNIPHTAVGEKMLMTIGNAFDINASRRIVESRRLGDRVGELIVEYTFRNHKKQSVELQVMQRFQQEWEVTSSTMPIAKRSARQAEWNVPIPAKGVVSLSYTVRLTW